MATDQKARVCMVGVDGSKHSDIAVKWFYNNVYREGDKVLLAHCVDHRKHMTYGSVSMIPGNPDSVTHAFNAEEKKAKEVLEKYLEQCKQFGFEAEAVKVFGEPGSGIILASKERNADLIVTGCRGLGQIRRTVLGSVSDYIIHHSDVPVFVCRH